MCNYQKNNVNRLKSFHFNYLELLEDSQADSVVNVIGQMMVDGELDPLFIIFMQYINVNHLSLIVRII